MRNGWVGLYWENFLPSLPKAEWQHPSQGPGGILQALPQVVKKSFSLGSRNPAAQKDCFTQADLSLLMSVFYFQPTQATWRMLWLSCQKRNPGHTKGKVFCGQQPFLFLLWTNPKTSRDHMCRDNSTVFSPARGFMSWRGPCAQALGAYSIPASVWPQSLAHCLQTLAQAPIQFSIIFCPFLSLLHSSSQFAPIHVIESNTAHCPVTENWNIALNFLILKLCQLWKKIALHVEGK